MTERIPRSSVRKHPVRNGGLRCRLTRLGKEPACSVFSSGSAAEPTSRPSPPDRISGPAESWSRHEDEPRHLGARLDGHAIRARRLPAAVGRRDDGPARAARDRRPRRSDGRLRVPLSAGALGAEPRRGARRRSTGMGSTWSPPASTSTRSSAGAVCLAGRRACGRRRCGAPLAAADFAGEVGAHFVIWPGIEGYNYPFQTPYRESWELFVDGIGQAAQRCKERGIQLFLEHKNSEPAMKIFMRNIGMTLHVIHKLRAQGLDNVKVNMDWQHLIMNGESLAEYAAHARRRGAARPPARELRLGDVRRRQHGRRDGLHGDARARARAAAGGLRRQRRAARLRPLPVHRGRRRGRAAQRPPVALHRRRSPRGSTTRRFARPSPRKDAVRASELVYAALGA